MDYGAVNAALRQEDKFMGAAQPANTTIGVEYRLRIFRNNSRHTSVKNLTAPFETALVSVPGEEIQVIETRDAAFKTDAFRFGHPVVVEPRAPLTMADALTNISDMDFPVRMVGNPREVQIQKKFANRTDDLHAEVRTEQSGNAFTA